MLTRRLVSSLLPLILLTSLGIAPTQASDERVLDVVSVSWDGAKTDVTVKEVENAIKNEVGDRWKSYTTLEGSTANKTLNFVHGKTLEDPILLSAPMGCEGNQGTAFMNAVRIEAYKRLGIESWSSRYLVILTPSAGCIWTGRALIGKIGIPGGVMTLHNSASAFVIVHELGHAIGLGHSNFLRCDSGRNDGPWGSDCKAVEYGGTVDVMGNVDVDTPLSTYSQWLLGYLEDSEVKQSWLNEKIELNAADVFGGTRAVFLRDGRSTYWIEYRRAKVGAPYKPGLVIYRTDPPPISAVVSPNPEDSLSPEFDADVTSDIWMLNWDNYTYVRSRANGSMTLPEGKTATVFSGNISISASATSNPNRISLSISRKPDVIPPPTPEITDPSTWRYPGASVLKSGYGDADSTISGFEVEINGKIVELQGSENESFTPTYLNPFTPDKTVYVRDLPEGDYTIALRAKDIWGNLSSWSRSVKAYVDRGNPIVTNGYEISSINEQETVISWTGLKDEGIGLCNTTLHNPEGVVLARYADKTAPKLKFATGTSTQAGVQVFDCLGNGMSGELNASTSFTPATNSRRTGKWTTAPSAYGAGALKCIGKCTASISTRGSVSVITAEGSSEIFLSGKSVQKNSTTTGQQFSKPIEIGSGNKVLRVSGRNFIFVGLAGATFSISEFKPLAQLPEIMDPSLNDPTQLELSRFGFTAQDFIQGWTVLPMARGTTLLDPTLDLCGSDYKSESGRIARRQVTATKVGSPYSFLSTENVKYRNIDAAKAAFDELQAKYELCVKNGGVTESGILTKYALERFPSPTTKDPQIQQLLIRATIGEGVSARQLLAFYQFKGQYFSGLYISINNQKTFTKDEDSRWQNVANQLANRLTK